MEYWIVSRLELWNISGGELFGESILHIQRSGRPFHISEILRNLTHLLLQFVKGGNSDLVLFHGSDPSGKGLHHGRQCLGGFVDVLNVFSSGH